MSFARKFGDKYSKKLIDTATKTGIDAAKTASERVVQKTAEVTGDLIGNKIADKITSIGKSKEKTNKPEEIYIPPEKRQQIIDDLRLFWTNTLKYIHNHHNHNNHNNHNNYNNHNNHNKKFFLLYKNGISKNYKFTQNNP